MKRGFTLVEMLIVVVVLVTLMSITFRLSSIGDDQTRRNATIARLQRVEYCLSGYMAAFGSYPPVRLHASQRIDLEVNSHGMQKGQEGTLNWLWDIDKFRAWVQEDFPYMSGSYQPEEAHTWTMVKAACQAQPIGCSFPFKDGCSAAISFKSNEFKRRANSDEKRYKKYRKEKFKAGFDDLINGGHLGQFRKDGENDHKDWREAQVFKFGVMSYLLPRYLFMLDFKSEAINQLTQLKQWTGNNAPLSSPYNGDVLLWSDVSEKAKKRKDTRDYVEIASIPSQAACARWISNLEGICSSSLEKSFYGVRVTPEGTSLSDSMSDTSIDIYKPGGADHDGYDSQYILDGITVKDGWGNDLYYYSPKPYQTYTLWSSGPNQRTFPPWYDRSAIQDQKQNKCVGVWIEDDIVQLSN